MDENRTLFDNFPEKMLLFHKGSQFSARFGQHSQKQKYNKMKFFKHQPFHYFYGHPFISTTLHALLKQLKWPNLAELECIALIFDISFKN